MAWGGIRRTPGFLQKKNKKTGELGEGFVKRELERRGFKMVERVHTPFTVIRRGDQIVGAFPKERVSGDFIAIQPLTGRKVLVEVKTKDEGTFPFSLLKDHQARALNENHICGGISLLALVRGIQTQIHEWPIEGFGPRKSLKWGTTPSTTHGEF